MSLPLLTGTQETATPNKAVTCDVPVSDLLVENTCSLKQYSMTACTCVAKTEIFTAVATTPL